MRNSNNSLETVNAAATAIVNAEGRVQQATVRKRRWGSCWNVYWCFGSNTHGKRIGHAVLVPEPTVPGTAAPENPTHHSSTIALPFVAPPSSPASFLQSDPPSSTQSPAGLLSLNSLSANVYSPGEPASIFATGPYAHETQLVSPPVFSTFTTEPSTAPVTPPPESVHLTTPPSPEVPFAQLLTSSLDHNHRTGEAGQRFPLSHYEFQAYQLYPGSPVGYLISPRSGISGSGTSSPFPDREFRGHSILEFRTGEPPKLLNFDGLYTGKWGPQQGSGSMTPDAAIPPSRDSILLENQISEVASLANSDIGSQNGEIVIDHRVSFELTADEIPSCVEKEPVALVDSVSEFLPVTAAAAVTTERDGISSEADDTCECSVGEISNEMPDKAVGSREDEEEQRQQEKHPSLTLGSVKEFKFDNADGGASDKPTVGSDWWANEKVLGKETVPPNNWTFFPRMQPGIS